MNRTRLKSLYLTACAVLMAALAVVSTLVVAETRGHAKTTSEALYHEDVRTALWRMETRVSSMIATTTVHQKKPDPSNAYSNFAVAPGANELNDVAPPAGWLQAEIVEAADEAYVVACGLMNDPPEAAAQVEPQGWTSTPQERSAQRGPVRSQSEFRARQTSSNVGQVVCANRDVAGSDSWTMGPLASVWTGDQEDLDLYLARRVEAGGTVRHESFRVPWPELQALLLTEIADLFPEATLMPLTERPAPAGVELGRELPTEDDAFRLASIPVRLVASPNVVAPIALMPLVTLGVGWGALLIGLGLGWMALRSSVAYGDKHRRFTHAVTHELRTPLTTFRMYSEMLSRGMVPEHAQGEYLSTLESESLRLSGLVENVLRYAQLEEGAIQATSEEFDAEGVLALLAPSLQAITDRAHATLTLECLPSPSTLHRLDPDAVTQVATNLVENACKYAGTDDAGAQVTVSVAAAEGRLTVEVADEGPGVPSQHSQRIFEPFERAGRDSSDRAPGVGLGLALSRDLARRLGGDLELLPSQRGARFRLTV